MGKQRQSWSVEEKLAIVLAVLGERQSVAEIGRQRGVNENQIYRWKERFLEAGRQGLNGAKAQTADQRLEAENNQLKKWLGEKALEVEILKKSPGFEHGISGPALSPVPNPDLIEGVHARARTTLLAAAGLSARRCGAKPTASGSVTRGNRCRRGGGSGADLRVSSGLSHPPSAENPDRARADPATDGRAGIAATPSDEEEASRTGGGRRARLARRASAPDRRHAVSLGRWRGVGLSRGRCQNPPVPRRQRRAHFESETRRVQSHTGSDFTSGHFQQVRQDIGQWVRCPRRSGRGSGHPGTLESHLQARVRLWPPGQNLGGPYSKTT